MILRKPLLKPDGTLDATELSMRGQKNELGLRILDLGIHVATRPIVWAIDGIAWVLKRLP